MLPEALIFSLYNRQKQHQHEMIPLQPFFYKGGYIYFVLYQKYIHWKLNS